jgi:hypothetical protein|tara:strand:- start:794 stop:1240 length:447 start_codon:yes stop_codon:yes gene_type:complete
VGTIFAFSLGLLYANFMEWYVHKYFFHGLGKKQNSIFAFHLREHHIESRNNQFRDPKVTKRETLGILGLLFLYFPLYYGAPYFYGALVLYGMAFLVVHKLQHIFPHIAKKYFWWHWNHHMHNQNKSWNVVFPLMDWITGTLEERQDES